MSRNPSQLFLLADHIKLSLLERQRAISLNLEPSAQDGQISRSLESLRQGIEALESQSQQWDDPLHPSEEQSTTREQIRRLQQQHAELSSQFHSDDSAVPSAALTTPNDPSLSADFARAAPSTATRSRSPRSKSVRFTGTNNAASSSPDDPNRAALFPARYTDSPPPSAPDPAAELTNPQLHAYHVQVLAAQDTQLDALGASIGRQRELSTRIGDELDGQALLLDDLDRGVDRHQGALDRARGRLGGVARTARQNWGATTIAVLVVILVLLIVVTKR